MHHLIEVWFEWVLQGGYLGIIVLMAMESSIIPVPSEIVIPPAAFLAARGDLSFAGVILAGTLGSYIGAALSYWISRWVGRPIILRFGKYFFIGPDKLERAELWLARYEAGGVFFARLLPVIRHLISIPAGIVRMNFWIFSVATIAGSALWCGVLAYLGDKAYRAQPDLLSNPSALEAFIKGQSMWIILLSFLFAALYLVAMMLSAPNQSTNVKRAVLASMLGFVTGGLIGFLVRPSLLGHQLSFQEIVRGRVELAPTDPIAVAWAQTSLNYILAGAIGGLCIALLFTLVLSRLDSKRVE